MQEEPTIFEKICLLGAKVRSYICGITNLKVRYSNVCIVAFLCDKLREQQEFSTKIFKETAKL